MCPRAGSLDRLGGDNKGKLLGTIRNPSNLDVGYDILILERIAFVTRLILIERRRYR